MLEALFASINGEQALRVNPEEQRALVQWLDSAILSGQVTEGVNYYHEYERIRQDILEGRMPDKDTRAWLFFLLQVDEMVDSARDIESKSKRLYSRIPIFDSESGAVIDYEEILDPERVGDTPIGVYRGSPIIPNVHSDIVHAPQIQCNHCGKWRTLRKGYNFANYTVSTSLGGNDLNENALNELDCTEFGFVFRYYDGALEQDIPLNSNYIVVYSPESTKVLARNPPPQLISSGEVIEGFGIASPHYVQQQEEEGAAPLTLQDYDIEFLLLSSSEIPIEEFDAKSVAVYSIYSAKPIQPDGNVFLVDPSSDPNNPTLVGLNKGKATSYYCKTATGERILIPISELHSAVENIWECGDPGMNTPTPTVASSVSYLRSLEHLLRSGLLPSEQKREIVERISRIKQQLHSSPEQTAEEIEQELSGEYVASIDREYEDTLAALDEINEKRIKDLRRAFIDYESGIETSNQLDQSPTESEIVEEEVRKGARDGILSLEDLEYIQRDLATRDAVLAQHREEGEEALELGRTVKRPRYTENIIAETQDENELLDRIDGLEDRLLSLQRDKKNVEQEYAETMQSIYTEENQGYRPEQIEELSRFVTLTRLMNWL